MAHSNGQSAGAHRTRNRILGAGLQLFNAHGVIEVSINRIASEIDISPGNLYYHFKTKQDIVEQLVRRLQTRLESIALPADTAIALDDIWIVVHLRLEAIHEYRFVYRDAEYLASEWPRVAHRVQNITGRTVAKTRALCVALARAGVIQAEPEDLDSLTLQIVFTETCWSSFAGILPPETVQANASGRSAYQVLTLLAPYLSEEACLYMKYLRSKYVK